MAMRIPMSSQRLLMEQGLVPDHCSGLELVMNPAGMMVLRYEVIVTPEHIQKLSIVFQAMASEVMPKQDG